MYRFPLGGGRQVDIQDSHIEIVGYIAFFSIFVDHADKFAFQHHFSGILGFVPQHNGDVVVSEFVTQICD